jgi:hypothetical protein
MAAAADMRSGYHDLIYYAKKYRQLPQLKCPSSGDLGPAELRLKRLRKTVIIMNGKFYLSASPWHNNVKEPKERPEGQKPGYDSEE